MKSHPWCFLEYVRKKWRKNELFFFLYPLQPLTRSSAALRKLLQRRETNTINADTHRAQVGNVLKSQKASMLSCFCPRESTFRDALSRDESAEGQHADHKEHFNALLQVLLHPLNNRD
jgi:hypothetical protein